MAVIVYDRRGVAKSFLFILRTAMSIRPTDFNFFLSAYKPNKSILVRYNTEFAKTGRFSRRVYVGLHPKTDTVCQTIIVMTTQRHPQKYRLRRRYGFKRV